jgi:hypothetical protein
MRYSSTTSRLVAAVATASAVCAVALPSLAHAGTAESAVEISACHVKQERNDQYSYAWCTVTSEAPTGTNVSVKYRSSMSTFSPATAGTWSKQSGTVKFTGGGTQLLTLKFAFKGKTPAQVRKSLTVTLSGAQGAEIGASSARVGSVSG